MPTSVSAIPAIETTQLMETSGFAAMARITSGAFVGDLIANDSLCIVSIGATGRVAWPAAGGLVAVDGTLSQLTAATASIDALTFADASADLAGGLTAAYAALATSPGGNAESVVLISTGNGLVGVDPLTLPAYRPTWVCAPGPSANAVLLNQIATLSGGTYFYMPTPADMATVMNQVRGRRPGWTTVLNKATVVQPVDYWLCPATVASGQAKLQICVVWEDAALVWTGSSNPSDGQLSVTVVLPIGITLTQATSVGTGFCVFDIPAPAAGVWYVQVMHPGSVALTVIAGAFGLNASGMNPQLDMNCQPQDEKNLLLNGRVTGGDFDELKSLMVETVRPDHLKKHVRSSHAVSPAADGAFTVSIPRGVAGSINCTVRATGTLRSSTAPFALTGMISIHDATGIG